MTDDATRPAPLVPADVDLRNFEYMPLRVTRLPGSGFTSSVSAEEFRAGVLLWCASWHEVPAGSLPDDDKQLARLAGYGFAVREWQRVREGALYGWQKCSDGLLYHERVAEVVLKSWDAKLRDAYEKMCDRLRKDNKKLAEKGLQTAHIPSFEQWKAERVPPESPDRSGGIPPENALKGREGNGRDLSNRDVGVPPTVEAPAGGVNGHGAMGHIAPKAKTGAKWGDPAWVNATATTLGMHARTGESPAEFKDRVYAAVEQLKREAKSEGDRRQAGAGR